MSDWKELINYEPIERVLKNDLGFDKPTEIQLRVLPQAIQFKKDILGAAPTGSGKTFAYVIPIVRFIDKIKKIKQDEKLRALIIAPTRELVLQIKRNIDLITKYLNVTSLPIIGGLEIAKQLRLLKRKPDIVIGTPGRLWEIIEEEDDDHLNERSIKAIKFLVIDEFDKMIEKNHFEEMKKIIKIINSFKEKDKRQIFVYSATLTYVIKAPDRWKANKNKATKKITLKKKIRYMKQLVGIKENCEVIDLTEKGIGKPTQLEEYTITCLETEKDIYLYYILSTSYGKTLIFCNSKDCVRRLVSVLKHLRINNVALHSELDQKTRFKNLEKFTKNQDIVLIASDIAARGLDIENIERVIHYQVPHTTESYVHRSGRTARGFKNGISIMLYDPKESKMYKRVLTSLGNSINTQAFPIDKKIFDVAKARVKLAQTLNMVEHRHNKKRTNENWFKKMADECEVDITGRTDLKINDDDNLSNIENKKIKNLSKQLNSMLKTPISNLVSLQQFLSSLKTQNLTIH